MQGKHSAILSTCIKLPFVIKIYVLSIFEWTLKTGFTVCDFVCGTISHAKILLHWSVIHYQMNLTDLSGILGVVRKHLMGKWF